MCSVLGLAQKEAARGYGTLQEAHHGRDPAVEHRRWCSRPYSGLRVLGSSAKGREGVAGAHRGSGQVEMARRGRRCRVRRRSSVVRPCSGRCRGSPGLLVFSRRSVRALQRRNWVQIGLRPNGGEKLLGDRLTGGGGPSRNPANAGVVRADGVPERLPGAEARLLQRLAGVGRLWCGEGTVAQGSAWRSRAGGRARVLGWQQRWEWGAGGSAGTN